MTIDSFQMALEMMRNRDWDDLGQFLESQPQLASVQDEFGETLLIHAARFEGAAPILRKLVSLGADPNHRARDHSNALAVTIISGSRYGLTTLPELEALLDLGADPNVAADCGMPAVHWAISQNRPEHAKLLLERGARQDIPTSDDPAETAQEVARRMHSDSLLQLLKEYGSPEN